MSNSKDNNPANTIGSIADAKYDDLYSVTPRQLEKELVAAGDQLAFAGAQQDNTAVIHYQNVISKLSMLKITIEHRARQEGKT